LIQAGLPDTSLLMQSAVTLTITALTFRLCKLHN
jgi:hypothetical protein